MALTVAQGDCARELQSIIHVINLKIASPKMNENIFPKFYLVSSSKSFGDPFSLVSPNPGCKMCKAKILVMRANLGFKVRAFTVVTVPQRRRCPWGAGDGTPAIGKVDDEREDHGYRHLGRGEGMSECHRSSCLVALTKESL